MPTITFTVSNAVVARLQAVVDAYNTQSGTTLTIKQWVIQTIKDVAISAELTAAVEQLQQQSDQDAEAALTTAIEAERQNLLNAL